MSDFMLYNEWATERLRFPSFLPSESDAVDYHGSVTTGRHELSGRILLEQLCSPGPLNVEFLLLHHDPLGSRAACEAAGIGLVELARLMDSDFVMDLSPMGMGRAHLADVASEASGFSEAFRRESCLQLARRFLPLSPSEKDHFLSQMARALMPGRSADGLASAYAARNFLSIVGRWHPEVPDVDPSAASIDAKASALLALYRSAVEDISILTKWAVWCADSPEGHDRLCSLVEGIGATGLAQVMRCKV